ncbi:MAG: hypothetical protein IJ730_04480 [Alphaproteobacteria bacterium]|nr:hypothetical protein [Alphaproteobacteria bacterium]
MKRNILLSLQVVLAIIFMIVEVANIATLFSSITNKTSESEFYINSNESNDRFLSDYFSAYHNVSVLNSIPIIKHDISEEIVSIINSNAEKRMGNQNNSDEDYEISLTCEYIDQFFNYCCEPIMSNESILLRDKTTVEKITAYPLKSEWELSGALMGIAQSYVGRLLLLSIMTYYKKNPTTPKIVFYLGNNGGIFSNQIYSGKLCFCIIVPRSGSLEAVYNDNKRGISYINSPRSAVVFHELVHLIHKIEHPEMLVKRYVSLNIAALLFLKEDRFGNRTINRRNNSRKSFLKENIFYIKREYEDEKWKTIKKDFCKNNRLLNALKVEFTNDEEFYTIFGFFEDEDGEIKRDILCESAFTSEQFGYVRCGHWGPGNSNNISDFNMMVNYGIPNMYLSSEKEIDHNAIKQEKEMEIEWTTARENFSKNQQK